MAHARQKLALVLVCERQVHVQPPGVEEVSHLEHHFVAVERLGQVVVGAEVQGAVARHLPDVAREHHDWQESEPAACVPESPQDLKAVRSRHVQVEQDEVGLEFFEDSLGLRRVLQASNHGVLAVQESLQHLDVVSTVVHDQDATAQGLSSSLLESCATPPASWPRLSIR
jgi:septum formation topological specificity factor MinE